MSLFKRHEHYIGIDSGTNTGFAVWSAEERKFLKVETVKIHTAMEFVKYWKEAGRNFKVRVEDARQRKWFGKAGRETLQGAGSIKRDATIWEDYLKDLGVEFEMVAPKNNKTKMTADSFKRTTKWEGKTNEHSRDAGMLVFGI